MNNPGLREIKKDVISKGGDYKKESFRLNGQDSYRVNGKLYTKSNLIEAFKMGCLRNPQNSQTHQGYVSYYDRNLNDTPEANCPIIYNRGL